MNHPTERPAQTGKAFLGKRGDSLQMVVRESLEDAEAESTN